MYAMLAEWAPPWERSKMAAFVFTGTVEYFLLKWPNALTDIFLNKIQVLNLEQLSPCQFRESFANMVLTVVGQQYFTYLER